MHAEPFLTDMVLFAMVRVNGEVGEGRRKPEMGGKGSGVEGGQMGGRD